MVRWKKNRKCEWKYCPWVETCINLWAWPIPIRWHRRVLRMLGPNWTAPVRQGMLKKFLASTTMKVLFSQGNIWPVPLRLHLCPCEPKLCTKVAQFEEKEMFCRVKQMFVVALFLKNAAAQLHVSFSLKSTPHRKFTSGPEMLPKNLSFPKEVGLWVTDFMTIRFVLLRAKQEL